MRMPNYKKSLLSLTSSVLKHYGIDTPHLSFSSLDGLLEKGYKNIVVMLFDGMGEAILRKHLPENSFLRSNDRDIISSVFPPTTTAATTTIETGLAPVEHAWLGWALHFEQIGKSVCIFPNTECESGEQAESYHVARRFIPYKSIFQRIEEGTNGDVKAYQVSAYADYKAYTLDEICDAVRTLCSEEGRKYIYTYWKQPDYDMHEFGTEHEIVHTHIQNINAKVEELCKDLKDTIVIVTADHGLIDTTWEFLPLYDDVWSCLKELPTMEMRALSCYVKDGMNEEFESAFNKHFGEYYELLSHDQVFESGLFGEGYKHPLAESFVGDYLAVAKSNVSLSVFPPTDDIFKAVHAGSTKDEYEVPFIVIEKR